MRSTRSFPALVAVAAMIGGLASGCGTIPAQVDRGPVGQGTRDQVAVDQVAVDRPAVDQPAVDAPSAGPTEAAPRPFPSEKPPASVTLPSSGALIGTVKLGQVAGPALLSSGSSGDSVRELQVRLRQLDWFSGSITGTYGPATRSGVAGFQAKRGLPETGAVDQATRTRLRSMTRTPTQDELHNRLPKPSAAGLDARCRTGRVLCISKSSNSLVWMVDGEARTRVDVRFGSYETPTREGTFSVGWKSRNHVSTIYHTPMPYAMFFSGGQAVHYSADFAARGYNGASHGCVNVRNLAAIQSLFDTVQVGDKVIVYR